MSKVGILGGTFDPIHNGHIYLAQTAMEKCNLDQILFLPLGVPPHKDRLIADGETRLELLKRATASIAGFFVSDMEIRRPGTTYTIDTLLSLNKLHPDWELFYIIGTDTLFDLEKWKNPEQVFALCTFICMSRPIDNEAAQQEKAQELEARFGKRIIIIPHMGKDVSSTAVRSATTGSITQLVPECIAEDVRKIYAKDEGKIERQELLNQLQPLISENRYAHSLSVETTAIELAELYGADVDKASLAALLHDCAKNISKDPESFAKTHHIEAYLHGYDDLPINVLHAPMGAHLARIKFGVDDPDVLSAITWHTSGKPDMSLMDKLIYLADYTEPLRRSSPQLEEVRKLTKEDLDTALCTALKYSIEKIKSKGNVVHSNTLNAYEYMRNKMEEQHG